MHNALVGEGIITIAGPQHLCHLINRRREPLCPINGTVVLFPLDLVNESQKDELEFAAKSDTQLLSAKLQIVCPLLVIITGMEQDSGFREFMKRLGRDKAVTARFGKGTGDGSRAWNRSTRPELEALTKLACASFMLRASMPGCACSIVFASAVFCAGSVPSM